MINTTKGSLERNKRFFFFSFFYSLYCMRFHQVIFITLIEICCWYYWSIGPTWADSWSPFSSLHLITWWRPLVVGFSLLLGWMVIVLVAWWSFHMCFPCWSSLGWNFEQCGAYYLIMVVWDICSSWMWMFVLAPKGSDDDGQGIYVS